MKKPKQFFSEMDQVRGPLEAWRKTRKHRDRIPDPLWSAMTRLAKTYGVSPVSAALRVEYYTLKDRVARSRRNSSSSLSQPAFIELKALPPSHAAACLVELEERSGSKMTLRLDPGSGVDALALIQAFWRRAT